MQAEKTRTCRWANPGNETNKHDNSFQDLIAECIKFNENIATIQDTPLMAEEKHKTIDALQIMAPIKSAQ